MIYADFTCNIVLMLSCHPATQFNTSNPPLQPLNMHGSSLSLRFNHILGRVQPEVRSAETLEALFLQAGVDPSICLVYCRRLNDPSAAESVGVGAETQAVLDQWLPTIKNVVQPFLL